ncbi:uncharacterized protein RJT21DRAFT_8414 [Scheffersomyces amazonensis]|uniref:uncharacterized protein n=1 Tax=Scheffersomyces amazonensis TaxID=1078765 RepID=UPI00315D060D
MHHQSSTPSHINHGLSKAAINSNINNTNNTSSNINIVGSNNQRNLKNHPYRHESAAHQHHSSLYSSNPFSTSSSLFPFTSLRDILSLIFILLTLPQTISLFLIIIYIILGPSFVGGKFVMEFFLDQDHHQPLIINFKQLSITFSKILGVNSIIFLSLNLIIHKKSYFNYLVILSKSIISSDLIGSSSINYINSISQKRITTKIQYDDNKKILNSHLINSIICFLIINYINYVLNWLNLSFKFIKFYNTNIGYINNLTFHYLTSKLYLILCIHIINSTLFKKSTILQSSIPNITDNESSSSSTNKNHLTPKIVQIDVNIPPISNIQPSSNSVAIKNFENFIISPFNSKLTILKNRLRSNSLKINSLPSIYSKSVPVVNVHNNMNNNSNTNGIIHLNNSHSNSHSNSNITLPSTSSTTTTSSTTATSTSLTTTTISNNITTIENTVIIQPFWSILAASKAILRNPKLFNGEITRSKNNVSELTNHKSSKGQNLIMSTILIDNSKVIFSVLKNDLFNIEDLTVMINNVSWSYYKFIEEEKEKEKENDKQVYLIIHGLSSNFQYEIDIVNKDNEIIEHFLINTESINSDSEDDERSILHDSSSSSASSLTTLQISLISTLKSLNSLKSKYKKQKKDDHKRILEMKNNIENLKNKMSKYNKSNGNNENRLFGKLKGLKHSVMQLEMDIEHLNSSISNLITEETGIKNHFRRQERDYLKQIKELEKIYDEYCERIKIEKTKLKASSTELQNMNGKKQKLINKQQLRVEEIKTLNNDLKNIRRNEILNKLGKRIKKTNDKFDTILPRVLSETQALREECNQVLNG